MSTFRDFADAYARGWNDAVARLRAPEPDEAPTEPMPALDERQPSVGGDPSQASCGPTQR